MTHAEVAELLGAWALDAVDPEESRLIEAHVDDCPRCRDEVALHREVAAHLAFEGEVAPPGLWDRIAAELDESPPPLDLTRLMAPANRGDRPAGRPGRRRRHERRVLDMRIAATLAAAAAVVIVALGLEVHHLDDRTSSLAAAVARQNTEGRIGRIASARGAREAMLQSPGGTIAVTAFVSADGDGVVDARALPSLGPDQEYQLWAIVGDAKVSVRLLGSRPGVLDFRTGPGVDGLAISAETVGGVIAPTKPPIVSGPVERI